MAQTIWFSNWNFRFSHVNGKYPCSKHFKQDYFARRLDFQGEEGILLIPWLKRNEFGITAFPSIHAAVVASDLRKSSSQSAQPTDTEEWWDIFFWAIVPCLDMLVSFLVQFFEKKSVRVLYSNPFKVMWTSTLVWKTHRSTNAAMETFRQGMA